MRPCISIRGCVHPSIHRLVGRSIGWCVGPSVTSFFSKINNKQKCVGKVGNHAAAGACKGGDTLHKVEGPGPSGAQEGQAEPLKEGKDGKRRGKREKGKEKKEEKEKEKGKKIEKKRKRKGDI